MARHFLITKLRPVALGVGVLLALTVVMSARSEPSARRSHVAPTVTGLSPTSGPSAGGTVVTVTGTGFQQPGNSILAVNFGLTGASLATVTVISDTQLTVTSPAVPAGVVDVVVGLQGGETSATSAADRFTFTSVLTPQVDTISPSSGPEAGGTPVTITGLELTGATAVRFGATVISDTNQFVVNPGGTQITMNTPPGTGTVTIRVTTPGGTSFPSTAFTYLGAPTVTGVMPGNGPA